MTAEVETRRMRTWDAAAEPARDQAWRTILKFGFLRMSRNWALVGFAVAAVVLDVIVIGAVSFSIADPGNPPAVDDVQGAAAFLLIPAFLALLLIGTPLFADDLRFNAPLFYFSRPVRPDDYTRGKSVQLLAVIAAFTLVPLILLLLVGTILGTASYAPDTLHGSPLTGDRLAQYEARHIIGLGDWLVVSATLLGGTIAVLGFLASVTLVASAHTRRGWHAGMALVAGLGTAGLIGASASFGVKGAYRELFGPFGWADLVMSRPIEAYFRYPGSPEQPGTVPAILLAYLLLIACSALAFAFTVRRLRRTEALL